MSYDDWLKHFEICELCNLIPTICFVSNQQDNNDEQQVNISIYFCD